jgi:hypothetical protein
MSGIVESYKDPIFIQWYTDGYANKVSIERTNIQIKVVNNQAVLPEIPDEIYGVDITNMIQVPMDRGIQAQSEFYINWATGHIVFHSSKEGSTITINSYWARGCIFYPASRIYLKTSEGIVTQTLQQVVDFASETLDEFLTGDVSVTAEGVVTIANDAVTFAKIQDIATDRILGRISAETGEIEILTAAQVRTLINVTDGANDYSHPNHTGDVTSDGDGATTIASQAVTLAKMQNIATQRILGRNTAGDGSAEELENTEVRTMINVEDGANNYSHPNHTGDITSDGDGATTIASQAVTLAKMQNIATQRILGRNTAGDGSTEELETGTVKTMLGIDPIVAYLQNRIHTGMLVKDATGGQIHTDTGAYTFRFNLDEGLSEVDNLLKEFEAEVDTVLETGATSPLDGTNDTIIYAIWLQNDNESITIGSLAGTAAPAISAAAPSDNDITTAINNATIVWYRLANFKITRTSSNTASGEADNTVRHKLNI